MIPKLLSSDIYDETILLTSSRITFNSLNIFYSNKFVVIIPELFSASVINYWIFNYFVLYNIYIYFFTSSDITKSFIPTVNP